MIDTYKKLHKFVAPHLENYKDDLEKYDQGELEKNDWPFIYGYRRTGTNMMFMPPCPIEEFFPGMTHKPMFNPRYKLKDIDEARKILHEELIWITYSNPNFLYFDGLVLREATKDEVTSIWTKYVNNLK